MKLAARFDDELNVPDDVAVHQVKEFAPDLSFGGSASGPGLVALALSDHWGLFGPAIEEWRNLAVYYAAITSEGRGRVRRSPGLRDPVVTYRLTPRDRALLGRGLARLALVMLEAGATAVYPSFRGAPVVSARRDLAAMQATFGAGEGERDDGAPVLDRYRWASTPGVSATDSHGLVNGTTNVFVNDASLLPDAPGVNPQASVMAVAIRNVRRFIDRRARMRDAPDVTIVTGAGGWFGRALLAALTDPASEHFRDGEIRALALDRAEADDARRALPKVVPVVGDVRTRAGVADLFAGLGGTVDVIHAAGVIHPATVSDFVEVNTRGTQTCRRARTRRRGPADGARVVEQPVRRQPARP